VVSVNTGNSFYVATTGGLLTQVVNEDLSSVVGNNGVLGPPGHFPTSNFSSANYFRDIFFVPLPSPPADTIPPVTTATLFPMPNQNGWNHTDVLVAFSARDNPGGSGVSKIQFSVSGAQNAGARIIPRNFATTFISAEGSTVITYFSTDRDGNQETPKTLTVRIDQKAPVISGMPAPDCTLWPPNDRLIPVATVTVMDAISGISPGSFKVTATSNQASGGIHPDVVITPLGNLAFRVFLRAERSGQDKRVYTVTAKATDLAGNSFMKVATCVVPRDKHEDHANDHDHSPDSHGNNHED
jgi:hypothetical protein